MSQLITPQKFVEKKISQEKLRMGDSLIQTVFLKKNYYGHVWYRSILGK